MLRDRLLAIRWLVYLVVVWGVLWAALPHPAEALPLPPARAEGATGDIEAVRRSLEQKIVRDRLAAIGLSPADAARVWERLSPEERAEVALRAEELAAGGNAAAFLAVAIIVAVLAILILELMGRRVISRP